MKIKCTINTIQIIPESDQDLAYLFDTIGAKDNEMIATMIGTSMYVDQAYVEIKRK